MAHLAIELTGGDVCNEDSGEDCGETRVTASEVEIVPI